MFVAAVEEPLGPTCSVLLKGRGNVCVFLTAVAKHLTKATQGRKEGFLAAHSLRMWSIMMRKAWQQDSEVRQLVTWQPQSGIRWMLVLS